MLCLTDDVLSQRSYEKTQQLDIEAKKVQTKIQFLNTEGHLCLETISTAVVHSCSITAFKETYVFSQNQDLCADTTGKPHRQVGSASPDKTDLLSSLEAGHNFSLSPRPNVIDEEQLRELPSS